MTDEKPVQETMIKQPLPSNPTLSELFEYYDIEDGLVRVIPLTIQEDEKDTRLALIVRGDIQTASLIFSEIWDRVVELSQIEQQQEANRGGSGLITP